MLAASPALPDRSQPPAPSSQRARMAVPSRAVLLVGGYTEATITGEHTSPKDSAMWEHLLVLSHSHS